MNPRACVVTRKALQSFAFICYCAAASPLMAQSVTEEGALATVSGPLFPPRAAANRSPQNLLQQQPQLAPARRPLTDTQRRAMRWGAAAGALTGLVIGLAAVDDCVGLACALAPMPVTLATVAGGVAGAGVGLIVGTVIDGRRDPLVYVGLAVPLP